VALFFFVFLGCAGVAVSATVGSVSSRSTAWGTYAGRIYRRQYVVFLRAVGGKIAPSRIFRSHACGQGARHADSWSRIL